MTTADGHKSLMPVLFLGHGSPMNAVEENEFVAGFRKAGSILPKPSSILCVSAHWETDGTKVTAMDKPKTIHDFGGFPRQLYEIQYPAPGNPYLAGEAVNLTEGKTELNYSWGLDHGAWTVIKHLYPDADVPVVELSLNYRLSPSDHFNLARELAPLRKKGVLIIGSGNIIHNLSRVAWDRLSEPEYGYDWALIARDILNRLITEGDTASLVKYSSLGKEVQLSVPTPEHYLPLLYALALRNPDEPVSLFNDKPVGGSLSMTSVMIGEYSS